MKPLQERNLAVVGAIGLGVCAGVVAAALQYDKLQFFSGGREYSAYFTEASGLQPGAEVQVAGHTVGQVSDVDLDGDRVLVSFEITEYLRLGERSEAAIKTNSLLGVKVLEVNSLGEQPLTQAIPVDRTRPAYQLPDALGDLSATIGDLDTGTLNEALSTLAHEFTDTPPDLRSAIDGVARFSKSLGDRDQHLRELLSNARTTASVLAGRTDEIVRLIEDSNALMARLRSESAALDAISGSVSAVARQLGGFIADNRATLKPALERLNGVLTLLDDRRDKLQESIARLNPFLLSLGESISAGPFFKVYIANLLPGQFVQPFVEAAFSDLGLDPNILAPSQLNDPQTGQPATPALPVPFPRTGQGGEPRLTVPDAISGTPGNARYPYREPNAAPPPGGPPPGPPADVPVPPGPTPVFDPGTEMSPDPSRPTGDAQ